MHSGAAIAAALKSQKGRAKHTNQQLTKTLDSLLDEAPEKAVYRMKKIEEMRDSKLSSRTATLDVVHKHGVRREKQIDALIEKVEQRLTRSQHYKQFMSILVFFVAYCYMLFVQNNVASGFAIEESFQTTILAGLAEVKFAGDGSDALFRWLQAEIVERAFTEPVCGDGTCEWSPEEYPGFGRFGCIADCNRYLYTTKITVDLQPLYNLSQRMLAWNLKGVDHRGRVPGFKWNVWSHTMSDFILAEDASAEDGAKVLEVPDGELELRLYQTNSMSDLLDISAITANRALGPEISASTVPPRNPTKPAFFYGDAREALAAQSEMVAQVFDYCFGSPIDLNTFDWQCLYPPTDQFLKLFSAYGVNGSIKMGNGSRSTATLVQVPGWPSATSA